MRTPHQIVMVLAYALKESKKGEEHKVADLSKKTGLHYMTTNDYLNLIEYIQNNVPAVRKINTRGNTRVLILKDAEMPFPPNEKTLLNMFDRGAFSKDTATSLNDYEHVNIEELLKDEIAVRTGDKFCLTPSGIIKGARIADKRAERVTSLKKTQDETKYRHIEPKTWTHDESIIVDERIPIVNKFSENKITNQAAA